MGNVVLVTGVARPLAGRVVRSLLREPGVDRVIGVDAVRPEQPLGDARFVAADIRNPVIAKVLAEYHVDTVVHLDVNPTLPGRARGGRAAVKETNVIGTMQLLGACQKAPSVRRLVVKSTTNVYGSAPRDPAVLRENSLPKSLPGGGFAKDAAEVEGYVRGFARRRPDVAVAVLRFANILGPHVDSPLSAYFGMPVLPTVLGYDPRLQFVHEDDVVDVLRIAAREPVRGTLNSGTFNIAGDGVLLLSQAARRLGRPMLPVLLPTVTWTGSALRTVGLADISPEQIRLLTHGRVVDTAQMRETLGFRPAFTTPETFQAYVASRGHGVLAPQRLARAVDRLAAALPAPASRPATRHAGASDAVAVDAGAVDAGAVDAVTRDAAGAVDAVTGDAGAVDAVTGDAGAVDAVAGPGETTLPTGASGGGPTTPGRA